MTKPISKQSFHEKLPPKCPPDEAVAAAYGELWRFVSSNPPVDKDFQSHASLNKKPPPGEDLCRWASCSLLMSPNGAYKSLPKPRKKYAYIAKVSISASCGYTLSNGKHVDFWRFKNVIPKIIEVITL